MTEVRIRLYRMTPSPGTLGTEVRIRRDTRAGIGDVKRPPQGSRPETEGTILFISVREESRRIRT